MASHDGAAGESVDPPRCFQNGITLIISMELVEIHCNLVSVLAFGIRGIAVNVSGPKAATEVGSEDPSKVVAEITRPFMEVGHLHFIGAGLENEVGSFDEIVSHVDWTNAEPNALFERGFSGGGEDVVVSFAAAR